MPSLLRTRLLVGPVGGARKRARNGVWTLAAVLACVLTLVGVAPAEAAGLDLRRGSRGPSVRTLEARLAQLRLLPASAVDGRYRTATVRAVRKFQRQHRVRVTGRVNTRTWTLLAKAVASRPVSPPSPPPVAPAPAPAPVILGHRGGVYASAPENTLAAMRLAAKSADALEFDLRLTSDGVFVLMHDSSLDRTTNCTGQVNARTLADLRARCTVDGEPIPTFDEVAAFAATTTTGIAPELKTVSLRDQDVAAFVAVVRARGLTGRTHVQSFHAAEHFPRLQALEPLLTYVYLAKTATTPTLMRDAGATVAGVNLVGLTAATVSAYQRSGLRVWSYTARTTEELRTAWNLRVDGVFTDLPAQARAMYHPAG